MTTTENAKSQARAQLDGIITMVKRLEHAQDCPGGEDCELTDNEIFELLGEYMPDGKTASEDGRARLHDEEAAREAIYNDPLSVEVRSGWNSPGELQAEEYMILLCTGGPACRIRGELNDYNEPETAAIEYQDWFTPWEGLELDDDEKKYLLTYAEQFYFGE
jgi:hypothetical protein